MITAPSSMPRSWVVICTKTRTLRRKPRKMARPPMPGDGVVVHPAAVLGHVHRTHPERQGADHRRGDQRRHQAAPPAGRSELGDQPFCRINMGTEDSSDQRGTKPTFL